MLAALACQCIVQFGATVIHVCGDLVHLCLPDSNPVFSWVIQEDQYISIEVHSLYW